MAWTQNAMLAPDDQFPHEDYPMEQPHEQPHDDDKADTITQDRAARRFYQIRHMDAHLQKLDKRIHDAADKLKTLKEQRAAQIDAMREAARDEGALPLFDDLD